MAGNLNSYLSYLITNVPHLSNKGLRMRIYKFFEPIVFFLSVRPRRLGDQDVYQKWFSSAFLSSSQFKGIRLI